MADIGSHDGQVCARRKRIRRMLPSRVRLTFRKACVLCRKMPRVTGTDGEQGFHVSDGVLIPRSGCTSDGREVDGNFKLVDRWVSGRRIQVWPHKARGSRGHHKFLVTITDGSVS